MSNKEKLIVALDVDSEIKALDLVEKLKNDVGFFKIGLELFSSCGPDIVKKIKKKGCSVFLDLKLHDIPTTVAKTAASLIRLGVDIINVHALGGSEMMKKTAEAVETESKRLKITRPKVIAVTILTSMDENSLKKAGIDDNMESQVLRLAASAKDSGLDGVVTSPSEVKLIRKNMGKDFLIVTPGVRPSWAAANDQKRIATPREAADFGADFIVIGRPITEASDPAEAAKRVIEEIG